eukprot:6205743-Pleurochrysis_carterae.AAC.4
METTKLSQIHVGVSSRLSFPFAVDAFNASARAWTKLCAASSCARTYSTAESRARPGAAATSSAVRVVAARILCCVLTAASAVSSSIALTRACASSRALRGAAITASLAASTPLFTSSSFCAAVVAMTPGAARIPSALACAAACTAFTCAFMPSTADWTAPAAAFCIRTGVALTSHKKARLASLSCVVTSSTTRSKKERDATRAASVFAAA